VCRVVVGQILKFGVGRGTRLRLHGPISIGKVENRMRLVLLGVIITNLRRSNPRLRPDLVAEENIYLFRR
jgi:hypothetical protein